MFCCDCATGKVDFQSVKVNLVCSPCQGKCKIHLDFFISPMTYEWNMDANTQVYTELPFGSLCVTYVRLTPGSSLRLSLGVM